MHVGHHRGGVARRKSFLMNALLGSDLLAWRYNPRLLIHALVVSLGLSLVGMAMVPAGAVRGGKLETKLQ